MDKVAMIRAEIERRMKINQWDTSEGSDVAFTEDFKILSYIDSLEKKEAQEEIPRPKTNPWLGSLSSCSENKDTNNKPKIQGLDEAATFSSIDYVDSIPDGGTDKHPWNDEDVETAYQNGFKAGAEWMAGQGYTKEAVIGMDTEEIHIIVSQQTLDELELCPGDKVIVQIRKK